MCIHLSSTLTWVDENGCVWCVVQSKPIAIGSATPDDVVHNSDLETLVETSDEWIRTR